MNARKYSALVIGMTAALCLSGAAHVYAQTAAPAPGIGAPATPTQNSLGPGLPGSVSPTTGQTATPPKPPPVVKYKVDRSGDDTGQDVEPPAPDDVSYLQNLQKDNTAKNSGLPFDIRKEAIKDGATSYGARGGLAWRTYQIRKELELRAPYLDKVFDFRRLLIPAPSGLMMEPPIVDESLNDLLINGTGQQAAVSDRMYNIVHNAKIVSAPRTWRTYLEREWGKVDPPPDILRPETAEERKLWKDLVQKGWDKGVAQADEIFQDDLNRLGADFSGMVRYRMLLAQGMISPPYALQVDRGVTGGKNLMRVGDRAVQITGVPELITGSEQWQPANQ